MGLGTSAKTDAQTQRPERGRCRALVQRPPLLPMDVTRLRLGQATCLPVLWHRAPETEGSAPGAQAQLEGRQGDLRWGLLPELVQPLLHAVPAQDPQRQGLGAAGAVPIRHRHHRHDDNDGGALGGDEGRGLSGGDRRIEVAAESPTLTARPSFAGVLPPSDCARSFTTPGTPFPLPLCVDAAGGEGCCPQAGAACPLRRRLASGLLALESTGPDVTIALGAWGRTQVAGEVSRHPSSSLEWA